METITGTPGDHPASVKPNINPDPAPAAPAVPARPEHSASFGPARMSRTALWGAIWAPLFFLFVIPFLWPDRIQLGPGRAPPVAASFAPLLILIVLPLGVSAPFGSTILGWVALYQIRHSRGRLYGLGLAVADALLYPLLALDALICFSAVVGIAYHTAPVPGQPVRPWISYSLLWLAVILVIATLDWLIVRAVWRRTSRAQV